MPMIKAPRGSTKPEAGVIATSPATAPEMMPSTLGLPLLAHSTNIQGNAAAAVRRGTAPAIEAKPGDPRERGAGDAEHQVVRRHRFGPVAAPLAHHQRGHQPGDTAADEHDHAAGEIHDD